MGLNDALYPNYTANTQKLDPDYIEGDNTIANASDYNKHDDEIIKHQDLIKNLNAITGSALSNNSSALVYTTGSNMTGPLRLSGSPTLDLEAATKKYVDDTVAVENLLDRTSTTLSPYYSGDNLDLKSGSVYVSTVSGASVHTEDVTRTDTITARVERTSLSLDNKN